MKSLPGGRTRRRTRQQVRHVVSCLSMMIDLSEDFSVDAEDAFVEDGHVVSVLSDWLL